MAYGLGAFCFGGSGQIGVDGTDEAKTVAGIVITVTRHVSFFSPALHQARELALCICPA